MLRFDVLLVLGSAILVACDAREEHGPGGQLAIDVGALSLDGIDEACYTLTVSSGPIVGGAPSGSVVWSKSGICSTRYGSGNGALSYVGTCDAGSAGQTNSVELVLERLSETGQSGDLVVGQDYSNPCNGTTSRCLLDAACKPDSDTRVAFDVTVARAARQGFFDVAVSFADIFCSAKVDCEDEEGDPLELLFDDGERAATAVLALSCTAGDNAAPTHMYLSDVAVDCGAAGTWPLVPVGTRGSQGGIAGSPIFDWAIYAGEEDIVGYQTGYWNLAIGFAPTYAPSGSSIASPACVLRAVASASQDALTLDTTPVGAVYPLIDVTVPLNGSGGALACGQHPLDGMRQIAGEETATPSGVHTGYTTGTCFRNRGQVTTNDLVLTRASCAPNVVSASGGTTIVASGSAAANGTSQASITITLKNDIGAPIAGITPTFSATGTGNVYGACTPSSASGISTCTMTSTVPGTKSLSITTPLTLVGGDVVFAPAPSASYSTITGTSPVAADGTSASVVTITIRDGAQQPMQNITPTFSATGNNTYGACSPTTSGGVSTCTLRSTESGTKTLSLLTPVAVNGGTVDFTAMCIALPSGGVSLWRGDGNVLDAFGARNGTWVNGAASYAAGKIGQAMAFNNVAKVTASVSGLPVGSAARTMEFWFYLDSYQLGTFYYLAGWGTPSNTAMFMILLWQGQLQLNIYGGSGAVGGTGVVSAAAWHHFAITYDGTTARLYLDGAAYASGASAMNTGSTSVALGKLDSGAGMLGKLDEVTIYNRVLSLAEIQQIYGASVAGKCDPPPPTLGSTSGNPGVSCSDIKVAGGTSDSTYWIDPDGSGGNAPFQVYCDQTTNGGGWILVAAADGTIQSPGDFSVARGSSLASGSGAGINGNLALSAFDAWGSTWTVRTTTQAPANRWQYVFWRPKTGSTMTPGSAGTNWKNTSKHQELVWLSMSNTWGLTNTTWLDTEPCDSCTSLTPHWIFMFRDTTFSSGSCLTNTADGGHTTLCHAPSGAVYAGSGITGTNTAAFGMQDNVTHAWGRPGTWWIKRVNDAGTP